MQGGASGALIVDGLDQVYPVLAKLPERVIMLRDQALVDLRNMYSQAPAWDISINYVPVTYPNYQPATIQTRPHTKELWRVANAAADTIFNLQLAVNGVPQPLELVALDGVPIASHDARSRMHSSIFLPPAARAEFIFETPAEGEHAQLITTNWETGPQGDRDPARPIANIVSRADAAEPQAADASKSHARKAPSYLLEDDHKPHPERTLYFSQLAPNTAEVDTSVFYYVTVSGQKPALYQMNQPPDIVVHQGDVEDWTVENRAPEDHVFHIHQIHFRLLEIDGKPVHDDAMRDTINVPYWTGSGPYPSVTLRMDFRDPNSVGTFLYHCHILKHEDMGMMGVIQVLPPGVATTVQLSAPTKGSDIATPITMVATILASGHSARPSGAVQFLVDGIHAGRPVPLVDGRATFTPSFEVVGEHEVLAKYSGDAVYDESVSQPLKIKLSDSHWSSAVQASPKSH